MRSPTMRFIGSANLINAAPVFHRKTELPLSPPNCFRTAEGISSGKAKGKQRKLRSAERSPKISTSTFNGNFSTATSSGTLEQNCSMASICFEKFSLKTLFSLNGCFVNSYGEKWLSYWLLLTSRLATLLTIRPLVYLESGFIDCLIAWHATATDRWRLGQWNSPKDLFNEYCSIEFFNLK